MSEVEESSSCRVAIIGAQRGRVAKVVSILNSDTSSLNLIQHNHDDGSTIANVSIEYLPCVATFGSYRDEASGETVKYLEKIEYHGPEGNLLRGSSLAPFFDTVDDDETSTGKKLRFDGISAVIIGCGIESKQDVSKIDSFVKSICNVPSDEENGDHKTSACNGPILLECIKPNNDFASMMEENDAYKAMSVEGKSEAIESGSIGPGKMARFAYSVASRVVQSAIDDAFPRVEETTDNEPDNVCVDNNGVSVTAPVMQERDPSKVQYACRICRTILFDEDDLEDPPHTKSCHSFSRRKQYKAVGRNAMANPCESKFLSGGLDWMGDISDIEGKLHCPKCDGKVGMWRWQGAQCSCGTWVTPAIQIPNGKVDELIPRSAETSSEPPVGTAGTISNAGIIPGLASLTIVQPSRTTST